MRITISDRIRQVCPAVKLAKLECGIKNSLTPDALWNELEQTCSEISAKYKIEEINKRPAIAATRSVYKALGKDPNRYRPSAEALCRRILRGLPLYRVSTLVDIINIVSIRSGFSIGGFDADKVQGDLLLDAGTAGDEFEAIGRGLLNIEGLPLYSDAVSGIGTPTSDCERTKLDLNTTKLLVIINAYSGCEGLETSIHLTKNLLEKYSNLSTFDVEVI